MATTLRRLRLKRVSLVDRPANEQARVVLFKSELGGEDRGDLGDDDFAAVWTDAEGRKHRKLPILDESLVESFRRDFLTEQLAKQMNKVLKV